MTTITSDFLSSTADSRETRSWPFAEIRTFWRQFFARAFNPYRPELHYMRGPGSRLARQAYGRVARGPNDGHRNPGREGASAFLAASAL